MPALFDLLAEETEPAVRAVLGHWMLGYVHPWTVIRVDDRDAYLAALEGASIDADIHPFASFVAGRVERAMEAAGRLDQRGS